MIVYSTKFYVTKKLTKEKLIELAFEWINGSPHYGFNGICWNGEEIYEQECERQKFSVIQSKDTPILAIRLENIDDDNVLWTNDFVYEDLQLSKASVTSYLPYQKGVYFPSTADKEKISVGAERQRRYRAIRKLRSEPTEEHLWETVLLYCGVQFKTYSGLPFTYEIRKGRSGEYTKELWIDRRGKSKSLAWSSVLLALGNIKKVGEVVERPKALSDIRGVIYIYGMFYRFGLIDMPKEVKEKKNDRGNKKQKKRQKI